MWKKIFRAYDTSQSKGIQQALHDDFVNVDQAMLRLLLVHWLVASTAMAFSYGTYLSVFLVVVQRF